MAFLFFCNFAIVIRQLLHKTTSIFLALLVLVSTLSFTIEKHFCGDVLVDVSVFKEVEKCAMEALEMEMAAITKKNCCKDEVNLIQGQRELKTSGFEDLKFEQQVFLQSFTYTFFNLFDTEPKQEIPHQYYAPPNIVKDIHVLDEVYLI